MKQLKEANDKLDHHVDESQVKVQTAAQYAGLLSKVEQLNVLSESNRLLRDERDQLSQKHQLLETQVRIKKDWL